ncbi:hypothetical protein [Oceanicoccus sp. KOV_DT_Chl]|uniref:hypothetical protein n=1 Tax=Oceanicoccus sp. KOV_DT_Chl TaxID=1904639 RepID=UPI000C7CC65A|nr:hypothetical protein [Oceanicoccus sp. KOV_DT_Chl]
MQSNDNVVQLNAFKRESNQEIIDDIGARAFLFLRDSAEAQGLAIKDVIVEHMMGLALVMAAVEGKQETQKILEKINEQLHIA